MRRTRVSHLTRGLGTMIAGAAAGQGMVVLVSPLLTRLYTVSDLGLLAVFSAIVLLLSVCSTLRLEVALVLPPDEEQAAAVAWTAIASALVFSVVVALAGVPLAAPLSRLLRSPALANQWWLVPLTVFSIAVFQVLSAWLIRERQYVALGARNLSQGLGTASTQVGFALAGVGTPGLLLGQACGYLMGVGGLASRKGLLRQARPDLRAMARVVSRYRRFPLVSSWSALLNVAGLQAPLLAVSTLYGQGVIGLLALTFRALSTPLALLGKSVSQVFLGEMGRCARDGLGDLQRQVRSTSLMLLLIGLVPAALLVAFGPVLFTAVFGAEWTGAGRYAQILAPGFLAQMAVSPISQTLNILERQGAQLAWDASRVVLTVGAPLTLAACGAPPALAVAALSVALVVSYVSLFFTCSRVARAAQGRVPSHTGPG